MAKKKGAPNVVDQLREAIRESGQSLNQLSKASGVGSNQLSRFMRGERTLTLPVAAKLCEVLHLSLTRDPSAADVQEGPPPGPKPAGEKKPRRRGKRE